MAVYCSRCGKTLPKSGNIRVCPDCNFTPRGRLRGIRRAGAHSRHMTIADSAIAFIIIMALIVFGLFLLAGIL